MKLVTKTMVSIGCAAAISCVAFGCSSPENATQEQNEPAIASIDQKAAPSDIVVNESGFTTDEHGIVYFAAIVSNPNSNWAAERIEVTAISKDESGTIIGTQKQMVKLLFANGKTAVCGTAKNASAPASVDFQVSVPANAWTQTDVTQADFEKDIHINGINEINDGSIMTSFTGEAVNNSKIAYSVPAVNVVLRAEDGSIVTGYSGFVTTEMPSGSVMPFSVDAFNVPAHASIEAYIDCGYPQQ